MRWNATNAVIGVSWLIATLNCSAEPGLEIVGNKGGIPIYDVGFTWNRSVDWVAGTVPGRSWSAGNPGPDQAGFATWSAEYVAGGAIGSSNEWFRQTSFGLLVWDSNWFGSGSAAWARANDSPPEVFKNALVDDQNTGANPLVRWSNPTRARVDIGVSGGFTVYWERAEGNPADAPVDIVMAKQTSDGTFTVLFQGTFHKPSTNSVSIPVGVAALSIGANDAIIWSVRTKSNAAPTYVYLNDSDLHISLLGPRDCPADLNSDAAVDDHDFVIFAEAYNALLCE